MPLPTPLKGIRVVDFTWVRAGPWAARWMGTLGAEVIKVEWPLNLDTLRQNRFTVPTGRRTRSQLHWTVCRHQRQQARHQHQYRTEQGLELVKRLISVSDIVIENFSSRIMRRWGLGYDELKKIRPDIIYVSMAGFGQTGGTIGTARWARRHRP